MNLASQVFRGEVEVVGYMGKPNSLEAARHHCWDMMGAPMPNEEKEGEEGLFYTKEQQEWFDAVESGVREASAKVLDEKLAARVARGFTGGSS